MPQNEDKIFVSQIKSGNQKAFERLFIKYHKKVYYFCKKILKNREESENLVQTIFMELWENRESLNEEKSFSGYLFKISKNKLYNLIRKRINEQVYRDYYLGINSEDDRSNSVNTDVDQTEELIEKIINQLPEKRKEVFRLSRYEGLTYKEIAFKLNISENTVDTHIRKSLDYLREKFGKK